ncbi:MAG: hypothetical protein E7624_00015 [Ruminococcaceae bacterium]|nr:hypothetical protein [Oscillospiraceae bacterium]
MKTKRQFVWNALLLTAVTLLIRTVSVSFNVYVSNLVGAEAMGLLSLVSGIYGFAVTLATSGIHLATVRTLAARLEQTKGAENGKCLRASLSYAAFFGTLATLMLALAARPLGVFILKDTRTVRALYMLAFTLLPIALTSVLNGYFVAVRRAWKNAVSQLSEQFLKIMLTSYLLVFVAPKTTEGCVLAILAGGAVSESFSLVLNIVLYLIDKRRFRGITPIRNGRSPAVSRIALPLAISAYARSGLLAIEHILIPRGLLSFGAGNSAALSAYGALHSMALPVVLYPAAVMSAFAGLLIPEITEQESANNHREIRYIAGRVYQMTLLFSIGCAAIMLCFSGKLGNTLYHNPQVADFIRALAPLIPVMYLDTATDALLKGLGQQVYSMNVNILDALTSVICVAIFVPRMGIAGCVLTIYVTELLNLALSITRLLRISGFRPRVFHLVIRPLFAAVGAVSLLELVFRLVPALGALPLFVQIALSALLYVFLLRITGTFAKKDTRWLMGFFRVALPRHGPAKSNFVT